MEKLIGKITHVFKKINVAVLQLTDGELNTGDTIHVKGHTTNFTQVINSMQIEHDSIQKAKKGDDIGFKIDNPVHEHDEVYKVTD
ncbi:hypothetical protein GQ543_06095 [candidate division WOR-3 bacterium]|nr:hypothetical protein [candidate division WOR-3 bacterium]